MTVVLAIGTRKGLWLATSASEGGWSVAGPSLAMREVPALAFLPAGSGPGGVPELLAGVRSEHWGPGVARSPISVPTGRRARRPRSASRRVWTPRWSGSGS